MALLPNGLAKTGVVDGFYPQTINQSLRFEDGDGAYLSRTPASAGNRKTFTWSGWVKAGNTDSYNPLFSAGTSGSAYASIWFNAGDLVAFSYNGGTVFNLTTNAVFRDPSAWYHVVWSVDTTQATASNRMKLYVNGEQITSFSSSTYPSQNLDTYINSTIPHRVGWSEGGVDEFDGYMAEVHFVDGTSYTADAFGETKSGIWVPKADISTTVTYGTNGFYLDFADGAAIGDDESGNTNDWTVNNLVASDVVPDSPTNNFCVLNSADFKDEGGDIREGGLYINDLSSSANSYSRGTIGVTSGKWYYEVYFINAVNGGHIGWAPSEFSFTSGNPFSAVGQTPSCIHTSHTTTSIRRTDDVAPYSNSLVPGTYSQGAGVVLGVAYDADAGEIKYFLDGAAMDSGNVIVSVGKPELGWMPFVGVIGGGSTQDYSINFGQDSTFQGQETAGGNTDANGIGDFAYAPPSGYLALCTSNLPDPAFDPAQEATADQYFNVYTYTGNGASQLIGDVVREIPDTYPISQSLRFEDGDSAYLTWMPATTGDRKKHTFSFWYKRGNTGISQRILSGDAGTNFFTFLEIVSDKLYWRIDADTAGTKMLLQSSQVLNDPSAWYHIVVVYDSAQATASDRAKMYVNGIQITDFDTETYPPLNQDSYWNIAGGGYGFDLGGAANYLDGYLAEVHFTDGTAYDADTFGVFDADGLWRPIEPTVTYGTNGFHLDFADSADIGDDNSGNTNDFTVNNLVASDVVIDTPTNQFAVLNPNDSHGDLVFKEGNLNVVQSTATTWRTSRASFGITSGKWYWEYVKSAATEENIIFGLTSEKNLLTTYIGSGTNTSSIGMGVQFDAANNNLKIRNGNSDLPTVSPYNLGASDVLQVAYDADSGKAWIGINNTWIESGDPASGTNQTVGSIPASSSEVVFPAVSIYTTSPSCYLNFGQDSTFAGNKTAASNADENGYGEFQYAPPTGFLALCENNLIQYDDNPLESPDFVWVKTRSAIVDHRIFDSVRGVNNSIRSNTTSAEATEDNSLTSFNKNGFTIGNHASVNTSGSTYVAWAWKAGGTASTIAAGAYSTGPDVPSIASTVSANTDAGFSIVKYVGSQTAGDTVGHGLTQKPEMIIVKKLGGASSNWAVYHTFANEGVDPEDYRLYFNLDSRDVDSSSEWGDTPPTSTVFSLGNGTDTNDNSGGGVEHIAYCFHSVDQYCKVGGYTGNNLTDGPFVFTGFRPKWVIFKNTGISGDQWDIRDAERSPFNDVDDRIYGSLDSAEGVDSTADVDFLSNGFKIRTNADALNESSTYIYLAFAEQPFKYSNAR